MSLDLHRHEIEQLLKSVTDLSEIAYSINRVHGTRYSANDIQRIIDGKPPRKRREERKLSANPAALEKNATPIGWMKPLCTNPQGSDPLAIATNAYLKKYAPEILEALAR